MSEEKKTESDIPDRQHSSDIIIQSIKTRRLGENRDNDFVIKENAEVVEEDVADTSDIFVSLNLSESIFNAGVQGSVKFREPPDGDGSVGDKLNFIGGELVEIIIESPNIDDSKKTLTFCINDAIKLGNEASDALGGPTVRADAGWLLNFVSCENFYLNWTELDIAKDEDYIGHIAKSGAAMGGSFDGKPGLMNQLAEKYFNPGVTKYSFAANKMEIENTHNSVWLKKNQHMYPWGKDVHHSDMMSMITDFTENAVSEDQRGVNYVFYADLDGWHFKSIRKMLADEAGEYLFGLLGEDPREYAITDVDVDPNTWKFGDPRIVAMNMMTEYNHLKLWHDGAYSAYYELVKPNYDDPYFDYLDFVSTHQKSGGDFWGDREVITYSYHDDSWGDEKDGGRVEQYRLIPDDIDTDCDVYRGTVSKKSRRFYDENGLYGYFGTPYNSSQYKSSDVMGMMHTDGKFGPTNDIRWRTMFDQTDLEGETLYKIQKEIKKPIRESGALEKYTQLKNLKERWGVYKRSICCDSDIDNIDKFTFLAVIEDAKKISDGDDRGGMYEYSWREVEFWPKDHVVELEENVEELSDENSPIRIVVTPNGLKGTYRNDDDEEWTNPAYNINELMNKTEGDDVFVGPGINVASDEHNNYPEAYQMMPVGGYFVSGDDPCEIREGDEGVYFHSHIVQMHKLTNYALNSIVPTTPEEDSDSDIPNEIYFFDVPNAHDGMCRCGTTP